ncbi:uncharacterized protein LOC106050950 [Biomphalaria glabrata]|uniref:Uncharacterized protein LOC106050950 n=1 Tax=Biomphalaria glabrata TaxID=6526 RepID=A0A9U8DU96_BIOGL|nr:uncharacterized protein LOC106050950 [Biomphalaria glabrata]XP_013061497.2 uncharacterized protein LOC106050950 [Biomphalaria glabrata]
MSHAKPPGHNSSSVQRASRINSIESARLEKQINYFQQSFLHQCRLTNRAIRIICMSLESIRSSSGHSLETRSPVETAESFSETESKSPFFLYGERIWSRKKRKLYKSLSASNRLSCRWEDVQSPHEPEDIPAASKQDAASEKRPLTAGNLQNDVIDQETEKGCHLGSRPNWEDDTDDVTKKIFKNQARAVEGRRHAVYQSSGEVMVAQAARNVRGLVRQIKISGVPVLADSDAPVAGDRTDLRVKSGLRAKSGLSHRSSDNQSTKLNKVRQEEYG